MNAYELAKRLLEKKLYLIQEGVDSSDLEDAATMIRKQADKLKKYELRHAEQRDRIATLEAQVYGGTTK